MSFQDRLFRIAGPYEVQLTDSTSPTVLPDEAYASTILLIVGTLTAPRTLQLPHETGPAFSGWMIENRTAQTVTCVGATGAGTDVPAGGCRLVFSDGFDVKQQDVGGSGDGGDVALSSSTPPAVGSAGAPGVGTAASRADHVHAHGTQAGGALHAVVTTSVAGFMSPTDKVKLDGIPDGGGGGSIPTTRQIVAGAGLTGGGDLSADRTINVGAAADGSISVTADAVGVGVLATDAQHGTRGGGTQHAVATTGAAGFLSAADKAKLDGIATGATATGLSSTSPAAVGTAAVVGVGTTAARSDHVHDHGSQSTGTHHAIATSALAGFLTPIGGGTYKILASSDGTTQTWTTTPTVTSLRAVSYLEAGTYAAVAASGVGAAAGLIAQGGGAGSAGGAAYLAGGAPGSGGSGGGTRLYTRGDASGATSGYLQHEVTEIQGRTVLAKFNGVPITATEVPSGNGIEVIKRALVSPTTPPPSGYVFQWVGANPGEQDTLVRAGPNGLSYTNHKRLTLAASSSGTIVLGRIREDLGQYAASPQQYKLGQAHGRLHVIMASYGSSWTSGGAGEFSYHGDYHAIRLNQASPSGPPGTWAEMTPTKGALSIALDSSLYLILTVTNQYATQNEAIVSWDWSQPW